MKADTIPAVLKMYLLVRTMVTDEEKFILARLDPEHAVSLEYWNHEVDYNVDHSRYCKFMKWWVPLLEALGTLREEFSCENPKQIFGFIGRKDTEKKLLDTGEKECFCCGSVKVMRGA